MSPIRIMRSYLEKVLSSILDVSSIKLLTFDSGRLYAFENYPFFFC